MWKMVRRMLIKASIEKDTTSKFYKGVHIHGKRNFKHREY